MKNNLCVGYSGCETCPIGDDVRRRMKLLGKHAEDYQPEYCWCDKIDAPHYMGVCEDASEGIPDTSSGGKRKTGLAYRRRMARKEKARRKEICKYGFKPSLGVIHGKHDGHEEEYWVPAGRSNAQRFHKKLANKRVRQEKRLPVNPSGYKRLYDYAWNWF